VNIINRVPIDLHSHTRSSDGSLSEEELIDKVVENGGKFLAITNHDTVNGLDFASSYALSKGLYFIPGVEISVTWNGNLVHILGLNIDYTNSELIKSLETLRSFRIERGRKIAAKLAGAGIPDAFNQAMRYCDNPESLSRTHFNKFLVEAGYAKEGKAFDKYLAQGKVGYVKQEWAKLEDVVAWIIGAGGIAIIAHPARYGFTRSKLIKLINDFKLCGGLGIEVVSSSHSLNDIENIAALAELFDLYGSVGSDFHSEQSFRRIIPGINMALPSHVKPIFPLIGIIQD